MPLFPEQLYQLSRRDEKISWLDPINIAISTSATNTAVSVSGAFNLERINLINALNASSFPAADAATALVITLQPPVGPQSIELARIDRLALGNNGFPLTVRCTFPGGLFVPRGWRLATLGAFSAATGVNAVNLSITGVAIPSANFDRV